MRQNFICFHCGKLTLGGKIVTGKYETDYYMLGLDKPYINLFFHKDCFMLVLPKLLLYLTENEKRWYTYTSNVDFKKKKYSNKERIK